MVNRKKNGKTNTQKFTNKRTAERPTTKIKSPKIIDLQGLLGQKIKNVMLRCSTSIPVSRPPQKSRYTCPHEPLYSNDSRVLDLRFLEKSRHPT